MKIFYKVVPKVEIEDDVYYIEQVDDNVLVASIMVFPDETIYNVDLSLTTIIENYPEMMKKVKNLYSFEEISEDEFNSIKERGIELHE